MTCSCLVPGCIQAALDKLDLQYMASVGASAASSLARAELRAAVLRKLTESDSQVR